MLVIRSTYIELAPALGMMFSSIECTQVRGPGAIVEVFQSATGKPCLDRKVWERIMKIREREIKRYGTHP